MNLKEYLYRKGIKQTDIVKALKICAPTISRHVNGVWPMPLEQQKVVADYLSLSIQKLNALAGFKMK